MRTTIQEVLLRKYIKELIREAGIDYSSKITNKMQAAGSQGLALFKRSVNLDGPGFVLGLYKPNVFVGHVMAALDDDQTTYDVDLIQQGIDKSIVGVIGMRRPKTPSYGAYEVTNSASTGGYGPMMHDVAMAYNPNGAIIPDRHAVSKEESGLYKTYKTGRGDVEALKLDDVENPATPSKDDDSDVWKEDEKAHLNYAFKTKNKLNVKELERNHEAALKDVLKRMKSLGWDEETIADILQVAISDFFNTVYEKVREEDR